MKGNKSYMFAARIWGISWQGSALFLWWL